MRVGYLLIPGTSTTLYAVWDILTGKIRVKNWSIISCKSGQIAFCLGEIREMWWKEEPHRAILNCSGWNDELRALIVRAEFNESVTLCHHLRPSLKWRTNLVKVNTIHGAVSDSTGRCKKARMI